MNVGFVGLGVMGRPMAGHLLRAGHALALHSRSGVPAELVAAGGTACGSARDVAARSEVIFTMVPGAADVEKVVAGPGGVCEGLRPGRVVVDCSSIAPAAAIRLAGRVRAAGGDMIDAPVSGGEVGAREATLTFMAGGEEATFDRVRPLFLLMGRSATLVGGTGHGQICKLANQVVVALGIQAAAEALLFATRSGVDGERVRQALLGGSAASRILEVHGARMLRRDFRPGARVALHEKDLGNALAEARSRAAPLPATALAQQLFHAASAMGGEAWDHASLFLALERLAGR